MELKYRKDCMVKKREMFLKGVMYDHLRPQIPYIWPGVGLMP